MNKVLAGLGILSVFGFSGCSSSNTPSTPLFNGVKLVASGVAATGTGLSSSRLKNFQLRTTTPLTSALCDAHGRPQKPSGEGGGDMAQSDGRYPMVHTYCAMTVTDGDTVLGGFDLAKQLICALEKNGIQYNGVSQNITIATTDTECFPTGGPGGDETPSSLTISAVGSSPASFNSHYDKGVAFSVDSIGLNFKIAANVTDDKVEFIAREDWSGANASDSLGDSGVMAGEITRSTGVLRFESRNERIRATCTASRCGWNRHTRLLANLNMVGGEPTDLVSFEYGYSDVRDETISGGAANSAGGKVITAKGALSSEIKARLFEVSNQNTAGLKTVGNWSETANSYCGSGSGVTDSACSSQSGIGLFSGNTKFTLYSTPTHTAPADWLSTMAGFNFTSVDLDVDNAF